MGSVRENRLALQTALMRCVSVMAWNSAPVYDLPLRFSFIPKTPIMRQIASAVFWLSPVMTITRIPAVLHFMMASLTSTLGGSRIPATPTKVRSLSMSLNLLGSLRRLSVGSTSSLNACAKQRSASWSLLYSFSTLFMMALRMASSILTTLPSCSIALEHLSSTASGAPLTSSVKVEALLPLDGVFLPPPAEGLETMTPIDLRSRENSRVTSGLPNSSSNLSLAGVSDSCLLLGSTQSSSFSTRTLSAASVASPIFSHLPSAVFWMLAPLQRDMTLLI
mmetsp:Transcript_22536/g.33053  ORF Transcript_22536/g.33053 Transcript_22536/m.33053 type:complete len:278 (+) Transcript_22536:672-1505(+)